MTLSLRRIKWHALWCCSKFFGHALVVRGYPCQLTAQLVLFSLGHCALLHTSCISCELEGPQALHHILFVLCHMNYDQCLAVSTNRVGKQLCQHRVTVRNVAEANFLGSRTCSS